MLQETVTLLQLLGVQELNLTMVLLIMVWEVVVIGN